MNRRLLLAMLLIFGSLLVPASVWADDVPEPSDIEEMWPEEVPTPWFCHGVGPAYVCVPPW